MCMATPGPVETGAGRLHPGWKRGGVSDSGGAVAGVAPSVFVATIDPHFIFQVAVLPPLGTLWVPV